MNPPNPKLPIVNRKSQIVNPSSLPRLLTTTPPGTKLQLEILPNGDVSVADDTPKTKTQLIDEHYSHLKGVGLSISEAAKKYDVPRGAMKNWVYISGDVHFTDESCYPQLVDEAEVALCAQIYHQRRLTNTAGLPYFDEHGRVITTVKRPASSRNRQKAA